MKQCPACGRNYTDETLSFCLEDGAALFAPNNSTNSEVTLEFTPAPTERIEIPRSSAPPQNFQVRQFVNQPPPSQRTSKIWMIPVVGVLFLVIFGGVIGAFLLLRSRPNNSPNTNIQTVYGNTSANSRTAQTPAPSPTIEQPPSAKLVGTWEADVVEQGVKMRITYTLNANGTSRMFFKTTNGQTGTDYGTWQFSDDILYEKYSTGASGKGAVRIVDENTFEITIIDNGTPVYTGVKRIYRRK